MSDAILEKLRRLVELQVQYEALALEQDVVTAQVIASATTARLEAITLALVRWEDVYTHELKALEGVCTNATRTWQPGLAPADAVSVVTTSERTAHGYVC